MKIIISFKHLEHTPALDERIREKSAKFDKYLRPDAQVHWVCWVSEDQHWAEVKVQSGSDDFFAKASAESLYKAFDKVAEKLGRQLDRRKDQRAGMQARGTRIADRGIANPN